MWYVSVSDGGFEDGAAGWTLTGGAAVVSGNEPFHVRDQSDSRALELPAGSSAVTPSVCVGLLDPTLRFFVQSTGSLLSVLEVDVIFAGPFGTATVPIGAVGGTSSWRPSLPLPVLLSLASVPVLTDGTTIAFRFRPRGLLGEWRIDDVYVDPFRGV